MPRITLISPKKFRVIRVIRGKFFFALSLAIMFVAACRQGPEAVIEQIGYYDTSGWSHEIALEGDTVWLSDREGGFLRFEGASGWKPKIQRAPVEDVIALAPCPDGALLAARFEGLVLVSRNGDVLSRLSLGNIANAVSIRGNLAFAAHGSNGIVVARIENGGLKKISHLSSPGWSHDVELWENLAVMADWDYGLRLVDIHNPGAPVEVGVFPTSTTTIAAVVGELSAGRRVAAVAEGHSGIALVDLSEARLPKLIARHTLGLNPGDPPHPKTGGWAHGIAWSHPYLFVANWKRGLAVLNIADLKKPRLVAEANFEGTALGVGVQPGPDGNIHVYLADGEAGLRILRFKPGPRS